MKILKHLKRLQEIHEAIKNQNTGRPQEFAKKLNISVSSLYTTLEELKNTGFPIEFSRKYSSYIYSSFCELEVNYSVILITKHGRKEISNGEN